MEEPKKKINGLSEGALKTLQREYIAIGKTRVSSWTAWLIIGLLAGATVGILFVANRSGGFDIGSAQVPPGGGGGGGGGTGTAVFVDDFNRSDSRELGNGWKEVRGDLEIASNELRFSRRDEFGKKNSGYAIAVQANITGEEQKASLKFIPANRDANPRFGVVLRYGDAQTYYALYREAGKGKTSTIRIVKFLKGVETTLGSATIDNIKAGKAFQFDGNVKGSQLFVSVDGKFILLAEDSDISSGSFGIYMGSGKDIAHRADDFKATVSIAPKPSITVLSPNGGEVWYKGTIQTIRWMSPSGSCVSCAAPPENCAYQGASCETCGTLVCGEIASPNPSTPPIPPLETVSINLYPYHPPCKAEPCPTWPQIIYPIASATTNDGSFEWKVGTAGGNMVPDGDYLVEVINNQTGASDKSDAPFSIVAAQPSINVSSPALLRTVSPDSRSDLAEFILVTPENAVISTLGITLLHSSNFQLSYLTNLELYRNGIIIAGPTDPVSITGGASIIFTDAFGVPKGTSKYVLKGRVSASAPDGVEVKFITNPAKTWAARWSSSGEEVIFDSDAISLGSATVKAPQPSITVLSPNGGEVWQKGTTQTINWKYNNPTLPECIGEAPCPLMPVLFPSLVDIFLASWSPPCTTQPCPLAAAPTFGTFIAKGTLNDGAFEWKVGENLAGGFAPNGKYIIMISTPDGSVKDQSDAPFSIVAAPSITVLSPNGGEVRHPGETHRITWNSIGISGVKIYIYDSNVFGSGSTNYITPNNISIPASQGYFDWTIPALPILPGASGSNYRIRIDDVNDVNLTHSDQSDAPFSIVSSP